MSQSPAFLGNPSELPRRFSMFWVASCAVLVVVGIAWTYQQFRRTGFEEIATAISEHRLSDAEALARSWVEIHPSDAKAIVALGDILKSQGNFFEAMDMYQRVPAEAGKQSVVALLSTISILLQQGRLSAAETRLRDLCVDPSHQPEVDSLWATLLSLSGQQWESIPQVQRTLGLTSHRLVKLVLLANPDVMFPPPEDILARMLQIRDPLGLLGSGRTAALLGRTDQAIHLLRECLAKRPDFVAAHVQLATLLLDSGDMTGFEESMRNLPATADEHPMTWFLRGRHAQELDRRPQAIRCYWEMLRRHPNHDRSTYQLGELLAAEGRIVDAKDFLDRARWLTRLIESAVKMLENSGSQDEATSCAISTFELGRLPECHQWCLYLQTLAPENATVIELLEKLRTRLTADTPWILPESNLAIRYDLTSYPMPHSLRPNGALARSAGPSQPASRPIAFVDEALQVGLQFVYFNAADSSRKGKRMFEYMGGGVAALDYDHDGWCDAYFSQGTTWPVDPSNQQYLDVMYRNIAGKRMQDVTSQIGIADAHFGQGVSAGDYDNDGFADLYVANIDGNRLYKNNGDGTFADVTQQSGLGTHRHWTTSCMIADLNGDSLPDVYDVTYLEGDQIFSRICNGGQNSQPCLPVGFPAAPDHVYANQGDGTFQEVSHDWGFDAPHGDGLGIVAADFDDTGTISLFVGNDGSANFFFVPEATAAGPFKWNEIGVISGLAYDDSGAAQACMGIGAGDSNNDGRLDLFVTNFYHESSTLYHNLGSRTFTDRTRSAGLHDSSLLMLGFGTQFIDADLDGWEDIVQTNGHIDDFTDRQIPYKMRPQFFQNSGRKFVERFGPTIGAFFDEPKLGRGLARLDWNRDGLSDVVISQIGDPAALLTNRTQNPGRGIRIKLVGMTRSRDALGTRVTVTAGSTRLTRQLVGGDGFQATNERRLEFGLAENRDDVEVEIRWMGGAVNRFRSVPTNREYLAIEGREELLELRIE